MASETQSYLFLVYLRVVHYLVPHYRVYSTHSGTTLCTLMYDVYVQYLWCVR